MTNMKELIEWHEKQAKYFSSFGVDNAVTEFHRSAANETKKMLTALQILYDETVDYVTLNNLGDPHHNQSMKNARDVLLGAATGSAIPPMPPVTARRPWDDDKPDGYLEGDCEWFENNRDACSWFLENADAIRALLPNQLLDS